MNNNDKVFWLSMLIIAFISYILIAYRIGYTQGQEDMQKQAMQYIEQLGK